MFKAKTTLIWFLNCLSTLGILIIEVSAEEYQEKICRVLVFGYVFLIMGGLMNMNKQYREFEIYNEKYKEVQGYLYLDVESEDFYVRVLDSYEGMHPDATFLAQKMANPKQEWLSERSVYNYIKMRIVPPTRHAINQILNELGLEEYNQVKLLDHTKGRCVMDFSYFREISYDGIEPQYGDSGVKGGINRGPINKLEKGI